MKWILPVLATLFVAVANAQDVAPDQLIKDVFAANPKTIVVIKASFPFAINWAQQNVPAIVHMAHNSQESSRSSISLT